MADTTETEHAKASKKGIRRFLLPALLTVSAGIGGFYLSYSGMMPFTDTEPKTTDQTDTKSKSESSEIGFVPIEPILVSLDPESGLTLKFRAQLEINEEDRDEVTKMLPRFVDVLNSYLRAVDLRDLTENTSLLRIRSQMLRRAQIVLGPDIVKDLLIMEFVVN